jgi:hypothetical protein
MAYNIEISVDLFKHSNISDIQSRLYYIADKYNYDHIYKLEELDNSCKRMKSHNIIVISFLKNQIETLSYFIKEIKNYKYYNIECIYEDDIKTKLIYASNVYLQSIDKDIRTDYKRNRSYSEEEILLLQYIKVC